MQETGVSFLFYMHFSGSTKDRQTENDELFLRKDWIEKRNGSERESNLLSIVFSGSWRKSRVPFRAPRIAPS